MEILLWLVPPAVVTLLAMAWVSWLGREGRGEVDREEAVRRMGKALAKPSRTVLATRPAPARDRSTGIAVRPSARRPIARPAPRDTSAAPLAQPPVDGQSRRAS